MNTYVTLFKSVLEISLYASIMIAAIFFNKGGIGQQDRHQSHNVFMDACDIAAVPAGDRGKPDSFRRAFSG